MSIKLKELQYHMIKIVLGTFNNTLVHELVEIVL